MFKAGDYVRCIRPYRDLRKDRIYKITKVVRHSFGEYFVNTDVDYNSPMGSHSPNRFVKVEVERDKEYEDLLV